MDTSDEMNESTSSCDYTNCTPSRILFHIRNPFVAQMSDLDYNAIINKDRCMSELLFFFGRQQTRFGRDMLYIGCDCGSVRRMHNASHDALYNAAERYQCKLQLIY